MASRVVADERFGAVCAGSGACDPWWAYGLAASEAEGGVVLTWERRLAAYCMRIMQNPPF